jgi:hypothetical protein
LRADSIGEARLNVAADGKRFRCDFIREGPVSYENIGKGIECLRRATIEARLNSFIGKPLTIEHIDPRLNVADPAIFAQHAQGVVDKVGRDADSGWFFCEGDITTERGREAAMAMNPSCGFRVNMTGPGGRWNNVRYERELTDIEFHHLALCSGRSRYEESEFRLNAILDTQGKSMKFKLLRTIAAAIAGGTPTTEEVELPANTVIKIGDKEVRLNEAVDTFTEAEKETEEAAKKKKLDDEAALAATAAASEGSRTNALTDDSEVLVAGKPVKVAALRQAYEARENAIKAEADRKTEEARLNAERGRADFTKLNQAATGSAIRKDFPQSADSISEKMKRGVY